VKQLTLPISLNYGQRHMVQNYTSQRVSGGGLSEIKNCMFCGKNYACKAVDAAEHWQ
jgi:hypothetical protein